MIGQEIIKKYNRQFPCPSSETYISLHSMIDEEIERAYQDGWERGYSKAEDDILKNSLANPNIKFL